MGHTLYSPNPIIPLHNSAGQTEVKKFGGLLTSEFMPAPVGRSFQMRQTYRHNVEGPIPENLRRLIADPRKPKGPPTHFHQFQTEYFKVEEGICIVEINGVPRNVTPDDEEISCKPGNVHAFYIHPDSPEKMTVLLSASDTGMDYQLDRVFFENWYGYWHDALLYRGGLDLIQTLQIHDAGDHYTPAPAWMPCRTFFGYWACVIIGRWLGGLLGYKPFFKEYTTDWDFAVSKMKGNFFTRWNVHESYAEKPSWEKQVEMSSHPKPTNAEYEELVTDMTETFRSSQGTNSVNEVNGMYGDESPTSKKAKVQVKGEVNGALNGDAIAPLRKRV